MTPSTACATCIRARELGAPDGVLKRFVVRLYCAGELCPMEVRSLIDRMNLREA